VVADAPTVFMLLMNCYYSFHLEYFSAFGLLEVIDKFVFHPGKRKGPSSKCPNKGRKIEEGAGMSSAVPSKIRGLFGSRARSRK